MKVTVETATLADAINKAARIAPARGELLYKAGGVLMELRPDGGERLVVKATDLEVTYRQRVPVVEVEGHDTDWRLPSALLAGILNTLPLGSGHSITLEEEHDGIRITAGRKRAKLRPLVGNGTFPRIDLQPAHDAIPVDGFAQLVGQVAWACDPQEAPLAGVHIDGERLIATDKHKAALVQCKVPVDRPITVPLRTLAGILKNTTQVGLVAQDRRLYLLPDADTQLSTVIFAKDYPNIDRVLRTDFMAESVLAREELEQSIARMMVLVKAEELPLVRLEFGPRSVGVKIHAPEIGLMEDEVDAAQGPEDPFVIWFTPQNLLGALGGASRPEVKLSYGPKAVQSLVVTDSAGYRCDLMPRHVVNDQAAPIPGSRGASDAGAPARAYYGEQAAGGLADGAQARSRS